MYRERGQVGGVLVPFQETEPGPCGIKNITPRATRLFSTCIRWDSFLDHLMHDNGRGMYTSNVAPEIIAHHVLAYEPALGPFSDTSFILVVS